MSTDSVNLCLSWDQNPVENIIGVAERKRICWVQVMLSDRDGLVNERDLNLNSVNLDRIKYGLELTMEEGAALCLRTLVLRKGEAYISVKYTFDIPP